MPVCVKSTHLTLTGCCCCCCFFDLAAQAPEGSPPDVWLQLSARVFSGAASHLDDFTDKPMAVRSLLYAAAAASQTALQLQSTLEQRVGDLEQQVPALQGSLTAVLAHLQLPAP